MKTTIDGYLLATDESPEERRAKLSLDAPAVTDQIEVTIEWEDDGNEYHSETILLNTFILARAMKGFVA